MFSEGRIKEFFALAKHNDNNLELDPNNGVLRKRDLVEAKMQIDRWGNLTTDWIFHSSHKESLEKLFAPENPESSQLYELKQALNVLAFHFGNKEELPLHIWGANVHFVDFIEPQVAIGIAFDEVSNSLQESDSDNIANSIVVFELK